MTLPLIVRGVSVLCSLVAEYILFFLVSPSLSPSLRLLSSSSPPQTVALLLELQCSLRHFPFYRANGKAAKLSSIMDAHAAAFPFAILSLRNGKHSRCRRVSGSTQRFHACQYSHRHRVVSVEHTDTSEVSLPMQRVNAAVRSDSTPSPTEHICLVKFLLFA